MTIEFDQLEPVGQGGRPGGFGTGRSRLLAGVAATMLVAAAAGAGYGIGRNVDGEPSGSSTSGGAEPSTAGVAESESTPTNQGSTVAPSVPITTEPLTDGAADDSSRPAGREFAADGVEASGSMGYPAFGTQPMETLFERVTDGGFTLRAQLGEVWEYHVEGEWGAGEWRPAPWCFESGQLRVSMTGNGIVDVGGAPWFSEPFKGRAVSAMLLGGNDGSPQWAVVVQAPLDVTTVRVDFADGSSDAAPPQNGIAVLTGPAPPSEPVTEDGYTYWLDPTPAYAVTFEGGSEPVSIGVDGVGRWDDPEFRESCTPPPPALPDAGEQPADPAAAEAEVRAAMSTLYGIVGSGEVGTELLDDPTGVAEAREQVQAGGFADDAAEAVATIDELVFTTPAEAWFRYSLDTPNNDFTNRYGIAVLVDGVWKITRATVCQDLSLAGGDCGGGWQSISPPGAFPEEEHLYDESVAPATTVVD
jgi:hypothetical protein